MLFRQLLVDLSESAHLPLFVDRERRMAYSEFFQMVNRLADRWRDYSGAKIGLFLEDGVSLITFFFALDKLGCDIFLFGSDYPLSLVETKMVELGISFCITDRNDIEGTGKFLKQTQQIFRSNNLPATTPDFSGRGQVILFTSGTSGKPKAALHSWASLAAGIKVNERFRESRWLLTYGLTRFAGIQVFLQAFLNKGCLVFHKRIWTADLVQTLIAERVEYISGTPTFWRKVLTSIPVERLSSLPVKQITLGGEIVGQGILLGLRAAFPKAQITHIYASTEMGVCFAVHDGLEGFPLSFLEHNSDVQMAIRTGELYIRSNRAMKTYIMPNAPPSGEWFATGDLVEVRDDRVYFLGRSSEIINVGGSKVYPAEVEEQIRLLPGVQDVRVFGIKSSITGSLVSAEVAPCPGMDRVALKQNILSHCNSTLAPHQRPRIISIVDHVTQTASNKIARP